MPPRGWKSTIPKITGLERALVNSEKVTVSGPLGKPVECVYGILEESKTAIIEMSGAAGITLVSDNLRTNRALLEFAA